MIGLLEHDDFEKSRKALLVAAGILLLTHHMKISGESFNVGEFTLELNAEVLKGGLTLVVVYFSYVFLLRSLALRYHNIINDRKEDFKEMRDHLEVQSKEQSLFDEMKSVDFAIAEERRRQLFRNGVTSTFETMLLNLGEKPDTV